eukprot:CAMPEP_0204901608 /NCGR_PEP_ID=MMETSP1397-20131031/3177_1 /ASSEMBLY_ACC=CAM_ASM_000891 /TAXON_ID=49980 /ORGANISM="Climacostomum Climacostomum virens, Strain Stock W-24" /LENGTH=490 /DNA_ID=CAMNT_0052069987 /DNA_START=15 /DNA_END=1487 /DNA_ORIENTATION=+
MLCLTADYPDVSSIYYKKLMKELEPQLGPATTVTLDLSNLQIKPKVVAPAVLTVHKPESLQQQLNQQVVQRVPKRPAPAMSSNEPAINWTSNIFRKKSKAKEEEEEVKPPSSFVTAAEQFHINKRMKTASPVKHPQPHQSYQPNLQPPQPQQPAQGLRKPFICPVKGEGSSSSAPQAKGGNEEMTAKGIEQKLIDIVESEIIDRNPGVRWCDIAGLAFAKKAVMEAIVWPLLRPDLFKGLRAPPRGLLLFGPPGTGKTLIGKAIASEVNATFFNISASCLTSKWVGEAEKLVKVLFMLARQHQPTVIFIDEIDSMLCSRSDSEQESSRRIKTEFLVHMDGAGTSKDDRILVIGATNRPQDLDEAVKRRLSRRLYIPLPSYEGRQQLICNLLQQVQNTLTEQDIGQVVLQTKGYSGADLQNLCGEAAMNPVRTAGDISTLNADCLRPVDLSDFLQALEVVRPTVAQGELADLVTWNRSFGSFQFDMEKLDT